MTITDFLLARIAEDEKREASKFRVRTEELHAYQIDHMGYVDFELRDGLQYGRLTGPEFFAKFGEAVPDQRALAECSAKRAIIAEYTGSPATFQILAHMAAVYKDHPDYQQEWTP